MLVATPIARAQQQDRGSIGDLLGVLRDAVDVAIMRADDAGDAARDEHAEARGRRASRSGR